MPSFSAHVQDLTLDLAWSLWAELGVFGWQRRHAAVAIDPEPLVLLTATFGDTDRRLQDEAIDWCIRYGQYLSVARLRHLLAVSPEGIRTAFGPFAATVNAYTSQHWPEATEPRMHQRSGRSTIQDFRPAALIALRLRALLGVSARAEIVRVLLAHPASALSAADLAPEVGYTKRNVADALDSLRMAGLLEALPIRNQLRYRLSFPARLTLAVGDLPTVFPQWAPLFRALWVIGEYARRFESFGPLVAPVEARGALRRMAPDLQLAGVAMPPDAIGNHLLPVFEKWALALLTGWASGELTLLAPHAALPFPPSPVGTAESVTGK